MVEDVLPGDDGVIDDNPQHHDEGEHGEEVEGDIEERHDGEAAEETDRHADGDKDGHGEAEEGRQYQENQHTSPKKAAGERVEALLDGLRPVAPHGKGDALGKGCRGALDVFLDRVGQLDDALVADPEDINHDGAVAVELGEHHVLVKSIVDGGDIGEGEPGPVGLGDDDNLLEILLVMGLRIGPQEDVAPAGPDAPGGEVDGGTADGVGHVGKGQPVGAEGVFRDLDGHLVGPGPAQADLRHPGQVGYLVADALAELLEVAFGEGAGKDDIEDALGTGGLLDDGPLGILGKGADGIDPVLDVVQQLARLIALLHLGGDGDGSLGGVCIDAVDTLEVLDGLLNADPDGLLRLGRRGAAVDDADIDHVGLDAGEDLEGELAEGGKEPDHANGGHEEVGGDPVPCKVFDHGRSLVKGRRS